MWHNLAFRLIFLALLVGTNSACTRGDAIPDEPAANRIDEPLSLDSNRVALLRSSFARVDVDTSACLQFFESFPETFDQFVNIYGYDDANVARDTSGMVDDSVTYGPLYSVAADHVSAFVEINCVPRSEIVARVVGLASRGTWQADAVAYLHESLVEIATTEPEPFMEQYAALEDDGRAGVMRFLMSAPGGAEVHTELAQALSSWPEALAEAGAARDSFATGTGH
jgi:hypothetical protein